MKGNYIFGNTLGKGMAKVSQRTQYEASLMSMVFILIGIVIMAIWTIFFTNFSIFIKIMTGINALAAWVFLSSMIITTFQQYQSYLQVMGIMNDTEPNTTPFKTVEPILTLAGDDLSNKLKGGK